MSDKEELSDEERKQMAEIGRKFDTAMRMLEDKTKYTSILELFNIQKLKMITDLDGKHVDMLTKFFTYAHSQKLLYGLEDNDEAIQLIIKMSDEYRINMISKNRKSRTEIKEILKESIDYVRSGFSRMTGGRT